MEKMKYVVKSENRTPIEILLDIGDDGRTTAKKLYEFLGMDASHYSRWARTNIIENPFAEENKDFWAFAVNGEYYENHSPQMASKGKRGNFAQDFRLSANFAKKLCMQGKTENAERAREYFVAAEQKLKEIATQGIEQQRPDETSLRLYRNNQWGILEMNGQLYNLTPDELRFIVEFVPRLDENGVTQIPAVVETILQMSSRNRKLEKLGEYKCKDVVQKQIEQTKGESE